MEPINLRPLLSPILSLEKDNLSINEVKKKIYSSHRRTKAIIKKLIQLQIVDYKYNKYYITNNGKYILQNIRTNKWKYVHDYLYNSDIIYKIFIESIKKFYNGDKNSGVLKQDLVNVLNLKNNVNSIKFNNVIVNYLIDWGERLNAISDNKLDKNIRMYNINNNFNNNIEKIYFKITGKGLGSIHYLDIPSFREYSCEFLQISRNKFDQLLIEKKINNPKQITLIGAPETTLSLVGARKIKQICYSQNGLIESNSSSVYGLIFNNKLYYYVQMKGN